MGTETKMEETLALTPIEENTAPVISEDTVEVPEKTQTCEENPDVEVVEGVVNDIAHVGNEIVVSANELIEKVNSGKKTFMNIDWLNISPATYTRWVLAICAILNTVLMALNISPIKFSEEGIGAVVGILFNAVVLFMNTYKNNSTSKEAIFADKVMTILKASSDTDEKNILRFIVGAFKKK